MIYAQNEKHGVVFKPQSVATNATASGRIDTLGYAYCSIDIALDSAAAASSNPATCKLSESDDTTTTVTDITAFVGDGTGGFTIPDADTSNPQFYRFNVDLRGRKRYLTLKLTPAGAAQQACATYHLSRAEEAAINTTKANVAVLVNG
jgi:hypothetical protein